MMIQPDTPLADSRGTCAKPVKSSNVAAGLMHVTEGAFMADCFRGALLCFFLGHTRKKTASVSMEILI